MTPVNAPRYSRLIGPWLAISVTTVLLSPTARAQQSVYSSRTAFNLASGNLSNEGFEGTTAGTNRTINGPIISTTAATTSLNVVSGFSVQAVGTTGSPGSGQNQIYYNNTYNGGDGTNVLTTNFASDSLDVTLSSNSITAFGVDLGALGTSGNYTVSVFSSSGTLLDTTTISPTAGTFSFFGITTTQGIARVNVANSNFETIDNVSFGSAAAPEPGALPLTVLSGAPLFLGAAITRRFRRS